MNRTPNAIWYHTTMHYQASVSYVNDAYRYEIHDRCTGHRVAMASLKTLAAAKSDVFSTLNQR
jgi:hypothetical protein